MKNTLKYSLPLTAAILLAGCGSSSNDDSTTSPDNDSAQTFNQSAEWVIKPAAGSSTCFDFDSNGEVACEGTVWDMKLELGTGPRDSAQFYTNSGPLASGKGGALGDLFNFTWAELQTMQDTATAPSGDPLMGPMFLTDSMDNAFASDNAFGGAVFEYHAQKILPKYSVFLVTLDNSQGYSADSTKVYAVQFSDYYGGDSGNASGHPKLRFTQLADASQTVQEVQLDASKDWTYLNLTTGAEVTKSDTWHLGFNRYNVIANSGDSGTGTVGTFKAQQVDGFYDAEGEVKLDALTDSDLIAAAKTLLTDNTDWATPAAAKDWQTDTLVSALNPEYKKVVFQPVPGNMKMNLDYGFYSYFVGIEGHADHSFGANPENGVLLRSGDGNSYARVHLSSITDGQYRFNFDVAPAK